MNPYRFSFSFYKNLIATNRVNIIVTNLDAEHFTTFGDIVNILDRLLHHANVINIVGRSYRTKNLISELEDDN